MSIGFSSGRNVRWVAIMKGLLPVSIGIFEKDAFFVVVVIVYWALTLVRVIIVLPYLIWLLVLKCLVVTIFV